MEKAEAAREHGNSFFKAAKYPEANEAYDEALGLLMAIEGEESTAAAIKCRLNKAASLLKLQGYAAAGTECRAVIAVDPSNAKAYFRLGQVAEKLGDFATAQKTLTEAIKLSPSLKEPRELLEAIKQRLKANPRLEQALQDMALVEERALKALNSADLKRARQQLELLLKDARREKEHHWEARALLGLALVCADEGELEGAQDYLDAARRGLNANDDRRAELYCMQTHALVAIDQGHLDQAGELLTAGIGLADEMGEKGLRARFGGNLAAVHNLLGDHKRAIEHATEAISKAEERSDRHFEALARIQLATALRHTRRFDEAFRALLAANSLARELAYSHVLASGYQQLGLLKLEWDAAGRDRVKEGLQHLRDAHKITSNNGVARAAVDDAYNLHCAQLRYGLAYGLASRAEALDGLARALETAKTIGYKLRRIELLVALADGHMREPSGRAGSWSTDAADLHEAEGHLDAALKLVQPQTKAHAQVRSRRPPPSCLTLRARPTPASSSFLPGYHLVRTRP